MNEQKNTSSMYDTNQAVAGLNRVSGFDPRKFLRKTVSPKGGREVLKLDLPYKKLWFRLAHPAGRFKVTPLRLTEQLAIFEAKVFFHRNDTEPAACFTAQHTRQDTPGGLYVQAAQYEALNQALTDAGFGLQFADLSREPAEEPYGSEIPVEALQAREADARTASDASAFQRSLPMAPAAAPEPEPEKKEDTGEPAPSQEPVDYPIPPARKEEPSASAAEETALPAEEAGVKLPVEEKPAVAEAPSALPADGETPAEAETMNADALPATAAEGHPSPEEPVQTVDEPGTAEESLPTAPQDTAAVFAAAQDTGTAETPSEPAPAPVEDENAPAYTEDMPVEEILQRMTFEQAQSVFVDAGTCKGWTMAQVADRRPPSLKWFVYSYAGANNIMRAAAQIMLDSLAGQKAG